MLAGGAEADEADVLYMPSIRSVLKGNSLTALVIQSSSSLSSLLWSKTDIFSAFRSLHIVDIELTFCRFYSASA